MEWLMEKQRFWTEQYLLMAFLIDNPKAKVLYGSYYNYRFNQQEMEKLMNNKYPGGGASFWFSYKGT
jgi:hypothetical protein